MTLSEKLDAISEINVDTKIVNHKEISSLLLYSVYFLYKDFPQNFNKLDDTFSSIKSTIFENITSVNNGADKIMIFYFLNKQKIKNTDFYKTYTKYLQTIEKEQKELGVYTELYVYVMLSNKINKFIEGDEWLWQIT